MSAQATATPRTAVDPAYADRLIRRAGVLSVAIALLLVLLKSWAWWVTDGVSLLASLLDSLLDTVTSAVNYVAIRIALKPSDDDHRFGHGKAESLAGLGQAILIAASAVGMGWYGLRRLIEPVPVAVPLAGIGVMVVSIALTGALLAYQRHVVQRTGSLIIRADSLHYATDWLVNLSVIVALGLSAYGVVRADAAMALIITVLIAAAAWQVARDSIDVLMDRELPDTEREQIRGLVLGVPGVKGVHNLRTRKSASTRIIQLDLEVDSRTALGAAHEIGADAATRLKHELGNVDVSVHLDPTSPED